MNFSSIESVLQFFAKEDDQVVSDLTAYGLLQREYRCEVRTCRRICALRRRQNVQLRHHFYCNRCRRQYSLLQDSFFATCKLPVKDIFSILWMWACNSRVGVTATVLNIERQTILQYYRYFRDVCSWKLLRSPELFEVGGVGHVVQIDECVVAKRKFNVGRVVPQKWVVGLVDCTTKRGVVCYVAQRSADVLTEIIQKHVLPGTEIWTDCWRGCSSLATLGGVSPYIHKTVNHTCNFVDPVTEVCTNRVEGYWATMKRFCRLMGVMNSALLPEHLDHFMWMERFGPSGQDAFFSITQQIAERYSH